MRFSKDKVTKILVQSENNPTVPEDVAYIISYINTLEDYLDVGDDEDFFGTEGWRYEVQE